MKGIEPSFALVEPMKNSGKEDAISICMYNIYYLSGLWFCLNYHYTKKSKLVFVVYNYTFL